MPNAMTDKIVADAKSLPDLIAKAQQADPELAQQLTGKALLASKTVWGVPLTMIVSAVVTRYGLGWDASTCGIVSGALVMVATVALRWVTSSPISGIFKKGPGA